MRERFTGHEVSQVIKAADLQSLTPLERLGEVGPINRVVFLGSSSSGKSTLEAAVRAASKTDSVLHGRISVPNRIITRPPRADDRDIEYRTEAEFADLVASGRLGMHGVKVMEGGRREPYGLSLPEEGILPVYFANNTVIKHPEEIGPSGFLDDALLVVVYAPDHVREERLRRRSPELFRNRPAEAAFRLSPEESSEVMRRGAHLAIENFGENERRTAQDVVDFLQAVVS